MLIIMIKKQKYLRHALCLSLFAMLSIGTSSASLHASEITFPGKDLGFVPHKALYAVKLQHAKSGSQIANIEGHMYYEWNYDCTAWSSKHRFNVLYEYTDSPAMRITSDFSNFEAFDGATLDYNVQRKQNGQQYEEIRGHAAAFHNAEGEAVYNQPKGLTQTLPAGTLYPMAHTIKVVEKAKAGKTFMNAVVFDGSDDKGPVEINAFIGKSVKGDAGFEDMKDNPAFDYAMLGGAANQVQLAFFPQDASEEQSDYEMNLTMHHNSIISDMVIDYDDFSVSQNLIAIEKIKADTIDNGCQ